MEKYGPPKDGKSWRSSGGYQDGPSTSFHSSSRSNREHPDRRHYDDLDDPNRVATPDTLPPPLYTSAPEDLPDNPNRYDHDHRDDRRRNSYGRRNYDYDSGDRRGQDRDNGERDQGWNGYRNRRDRDNRGDDFHGGRRHDLPPRSRGSFDGRSGDQDWRMNSSSNYNNNGGRRRTQGSEGWGGPPSGRVQGSSFGGDGRNNSWGSSTQGGGGWGGGGGSGGSGDWRNVGNASAAPVQEAWTTPTPTPTTADAPAGDWGGGWATASASETNTTTDAPAGDWGGGWGTASASETNKPTDAPAGDWGGGWGAASASETNSETVDPSTAAETATAWSATTVNDSWGAGATQSPSSAQSASKDSPPAPSDSWASGCSTQDQWNSTPPKSQPRQPSTTATGFDAWNVQGQSSDTQSSSNQAPPNWWGEVRQSPPRLTPEIPPPRAASPKPVQIPMRLESWPPTAIDISSSSPSHTKSSQRSSSSHSPTPVDGSRLSSSRSNSQSHGKPTKDPSQAKRSRLYSKILPHCQRAIQRDPSVPAVLKAIEASSLAVRLAVEKANVLDGLEEPALTSQMDKLLAAEKDGVNACAPPDVQSTSMVIEPTIPVHPQSTSTPFKPVTSNPSSKPVLLAPNHPNPAKPTEPVLPRIAPQPATMEVDSDDSGVLARWTCINQCSRATFAFSFNRNTREGNSTVILVCRSPVRGAVDPYNEDGTWQVFTTIINRGTEREEAHLLPPLPQSSYQTSQDLSLDITENVQQGQNTVELKRMMLIGGLAGFTFEVKLIPA
ncbi:hypothetical protein FRC00_003525 [Tulasnella sp. 408]|nr:hypothetical protein FRC00_003525 [Tulasnella sp. 408]